MSKRKTDETVTESRTPKRPKKATAREGDPAEVAQAQPKAPKEDLVVFAFRLKAAERDLIHKAAGAAKASRFVRALMVAASKGDERTVVEIVRAMKEETAAAS